jgi:hypothetical protein
MLSSSACLFALFVYALNAPTTERTPDMAAEWSTTVTKEADWTRWSANGERLLAAASRQQF